jgi:REP element-mobilizing transposase RayT
MPRRPRVEYAGYHHIINRGVARGNIFLNERDKDKFLEILLETKEVYHFTLHAFALMDNHYHLLIETKFENLSMLTRHINSKYAQYFNKTYNRVGPLWQGRFKNWYVFDEKYLYILFRYIEQNPIKANITNQIGEYRYTASSMILVNEQLKLLGNSLLLDKELFDILGKKLSDDEISSLNAFGKTKYKMDKEEVVRLKQKSLHEYFDIDLKNKKVRNEQIRKALKDGYKQSECAKYLGLSAGAVSQIAKK